jgi:hypothetical protein
VVSVSRKKRKFYIVITFASVLVIFFSGYTSVYGSAVVNGLSVPCTVNTYGNAWNGELAFPLQGPDNTNYLVVMSTNGSVITMRQASGSNVYTGAVYNIANDTLLYEGDPHDGGAGTAPVGATHIWNFSTGTIQDFLNVTSHHDIQYNPVNNTFLTLVDYVKTVNNDPLLFDAIEEVNATGAVLWTWDTYNHVPLSEASPFNETTSINNETVEDFTHANSLDWDYNNNVIYLNLRNTNTFYKINQTDGSIIWACGEFGNFTLLGSNGQPLSGSNGLPPSLWYHSHDVKEVAPDVFTMFDNDFDNNTNPNDCHSSLIEVTVNETSMTAYVDWSWEAPIQYWNSYGGANVLLPNGDYLGDFGDPTHQLTQNEVAPNTWNFTNTGAVFVELNPQGQIVRTFTFPVGYYAYRVEAITNPTPIVSPTPTPTSSATTALTIEASVLAVAVTAIAITAFLIIIKRKRSKTT